MNGIDEIPTPNEYIERVFGDSGLLSSRFPGYRRRDGQIAMARAVDDAIAVGEHVFAEGPTGTGKGLSYLVPASYHAARTKKKVVVVTANNALLDQLINKDLPSLASILPWKFSFALMKGKQNYLCVSKFADLKIKKGMRAPEYLRLAEDPGDKFEIDTLLDWAEECMAGYGDGDQKELDFQPKFNIWSEFSATSDECNGSKCVDYDNCFSARAHGRAMEADIIVTNYHMFFIHLALVAKADGVPGGMILPPFDVAILDEAHKAADIARDVIGSKIGEPAFWRIASKAGRSSAASTTLLGAAENFFFKLKNYRENSDYKSRLREALAENEEFGLADAWKNLSSAIEITKKDLARKVNLLQAELDGSDEAEAGRSAMSGFADRMPMEKSGETRRLGREQTKLAKAYDRLETIRSEMTEILTMTEDPDRTSVSYIELDERKRATLLRKPVYVGGILRSILFDKTRAVICTSATLSIDGNFNYAKRELGCDDAVEVVAESPFNFRKNSLLIVPQDFPSPKNTEDFPEAVAEAVREIIDYAGGRTLVLFTSRKSMLNTFSHPLIKRSGHRILCQDAMPPAKLAEEFRKDTASVLFGLERFWAGLDVPGESLSVVVIEKLPFPNPDDPILDVLSEDAGRSAFAKHFIPRAIITLKQGVGRLIRSWTDRGVVVILDSRILDKGYGKSFIDSLPDMQISRDLNDIKSFLRKRSEMSDKEFYDSVFE